MQNRALSAYGLKHLMNKALIMKIMKCINRMIETEDVQVLNWILSLMWSWIEEDMIDDLPQVEIEFWKPRGAASYMFLWYEVWIRHLKYHRYKLCFEKFENNIN